MKKVRFLCMVVLGLSWSVGLPSVAAPQKTDVEPAGKQAAANLPVIRYEKYQLANGLDVILSEDHTVPLVSVNLWYHVGPANERPGRTGFAHLFEHMMFQGSLHVGPKAHFAPP